MASITIYDCLVQVEYFDQDRHTISTTSLSKGCVCIQVDEITETCSVLDIKGLGLLSWRYEDLILADKESVQVKIIKAGIQETGDLLDYLLGHEFKV